MTKNNKHILIIFIFYCFNTTGRAASIPENLLHLLPDSVAISPFAPADSIAFLTAENLHKHLNSSANIYLEYGFTAAINQKYSHDLTTFGIDIFEMENSDAAFGIYSIFRDYKSSLLGIGDDGVEFDYQVGFWQDKYYIVIAGCDDSNETKIIIKKTAEEISRKIGNAQLPEILSELPQKYLLPRSKGIIKGTLGLNRKLYIGQDNIFQIDGKNVKAAFGSYKYENETAELILIKTDDVEGAQNKVINIFKNKYISQPNKDFKIYKDQRGRYYSVITRKYIYIINKASSVSIIEKVFK